MTTFKCENCGFEKDVPDRYADRQARCPKCQHSGKADAHETAQDQCNLLSSSKHNQQMPNKQSAFESKMTDSAVTDKPRGATNKRIQEVSTIENEYVSVPSDGSVYSPSKGWLRILLPFFLIIVIALLVTFTILMIRMSNIYVRGGSSTQEIRGAFMKGYLKAGPKGTFLIIHVNVPIRPFFASGHPDERLDLFYRWRQYINANSDAFTHHYTEAEKKPMGSLTQVTFVSKEERWTIVPDVSLQPIEGKKLAVLDPQHFSLRYGSGRKTTGCLIGIENQGSLPEESQFLFESANPEKLWQFKKHIKIGWDQVIQLYVPETIDVRTRFTLSVVFLIPKDSISTVRTIHLGSLSRSKVPFTQLDAQLK